MPRVTTDDDILENTFHATACVTAEPLPHVRFPLLAFFRSLFTPALRPRTRPQGACAVGTPRCETALDILAREYPDLHLRIMSVMG